MVAALSSLSHDNLSPVLRDAMRHWPRPVLWNLNLILLVLMLVSLRLWDPDMEVSAVAKSYNGAQLADS